MRRITWAVMRRLMGVPSDCGGATAVEYAVLLGLIVLVSVGVLRAIGEDWEKAIFVRLAEALPG